MLVGIPVVAIVALVAYHAVGLFRGTWSQTADADLIVVIKGASLVAVLLIAGMVLTNTLSEIPRSVPLIHWFITVVALSGSRMLWARRRAARDDAHKPAALLIGCSEPALRFLSSLELLASNRFRIFGMLDDSHDQRRVGRTVRGTPVIGHVDHAEACLGHLSVHGVFPERFVIMDSFRRTSPERFAALRALAERRKVKLDVINDEIWLDEQEDGQQDPAEADAKPLLKVKRYMRWRRPVEWLIAMAMVTVLSPLFLLLAALCLMDVGRPVFFWQMRPGRYLKPFKLIKFRTMRDGLDAEGRPLSDEARTSTLGRIIRRSKLDELPQLLAILSGDMSFIGPRPLLPRDQPEDAELRAIVRPGVTGWAQVNGGHPLEIEEKLALDIWYIKHASFGLDMRILWLTLRTMLFGDQVNRKAIKVALLTRQRLRPAARRLQAVAGRQGGTDQAGSKGDAKPEQGWWPRTADTLDRAS
jgi:lipopolysaccharide/colanic/teichoic acid biosynthesis glycosyltransferase